MSVVVARASPCPSDRMSPFVVDDQRSVPRRCRTAPEAGRREPLTISDRAPTARSAGPWTTSSQADAAARGQTQESFAWEATFRGSTTTPAGASAASARAPRRGGPARGARASSSSQADRSRRRTSRSWSCRTDLHELRADHAASASRAARISAQGPMQSRLRRPERNPQAERRQREARGRGSDEGRSRLAAPAPAGGSRVRAGHGRRSSIRRRRPWAGRSQRVSSTSTRWRRSRRASSMQARTISRLSHASKRSGSRSVGRSRQARTSAFCTASLACRRPGG